MPRFRSSALACLLFLILGGVVSAASGTDAGMAPRKAARPPGRTVATGNEISLQFDALLKALKAGAAKSPALRSLVALLSHARADADKKAYRAAAGTLNQFVLAVRRAEGRQLRPVIANPIALEGRSLGRTLAARQAVRNAATAGGQNWHLTWADEFNGPQPGNPCFDQSVTPVQCQEPYGANHPCPTYHPGLDGLDKCRWSVMGLPNWMNMGLGTIDAFNEQEVSVTGGQLILSAHTHPPPNGGWDCGRDLGNFLASKDCPFTSGGLWGHPLGPVQGFEQLRGRFEVRARLPVAAGTWPAHWLLPTVGGWPDAGEIDIMEAVGWEPTSIGANYHDGGPVGSDVVVTSEGKEFDATNDAFATEYHVFAVEWSTSRLDYFVDGILFHTVLDGDVVQGTLFNSTWTTVGTTQRVIHLPTVPFHWILNTSIANMNPQSGNPANPDPNNFLPLYHYIDYLRVYQGCTIGSLGCGLVENQIPWTWEWGNGGSKQIALWNMTPSDTWLVGDYDGDGTDELMAVGVNGWSHVMKWGGTDWSWMWGNGGSGQIALWHMNPGDQYLSGDFNGDGKDEVLALAQNGWAHRMEFKNGAWQWSWGNGGSGQIALWQMNPGDQYLSGDFNGDGKDEVLAVAQNGWAHVFGWNGSDWSWSWGNGGSGQIGLWFMNPGDRYFAGDFDGDGRDEVLVVAQNGWAHLMRFNGPSGWSWQWGNSGNARIQLRPMDVSNSFVPGDFYGDHRAALLVADAANAKRSYLVTQEDIGTWQWMREDVGQMALWNFNPGDRFFRGRFRGIGRDELLSISTGGWAHLMRLAQ